MSRSTARIEVQKTGPLSLGRYILQLVDTNKHLKAENRGLKKELADLQREHEELKKNFP
jgi:hypothetical protein